MELCSAAYRDMYALGLVGDALYMIGGQMKVRNHYIITDSVERWSLKRGGSWLSFAPLPLPLACHCAVSLKEHLYVLGGWTPQVHRLLHISINRLSPQVSIKAQLFKGPEILFSQTSSYYKHWGPTGTHNFLTK